MAKALVYSNESSKCTVSFDGEIVMIEQESVDFDEPQVISLYANEFQKVSELVFAMLNNNLIFDRENDGGRE